MEKILRVHRVNDYARYIGAPELHPLVSVIHYDELEHCRHSLNNYDVYGMFIGDEELEDLSYGQLQYVLHRHALMCVAPGQIGGKTDVGEEIHTKGWALLFDTELLRNTELGRRMADYHFFSYTTSEALLLTPEQRQSIVILLDEIRKELLLDEDSHTLRIVTSQIEQVWNSWLAIMRSNSPRLPLRQTQTYCLASSICYENTMMMAYSDKWDCLP